MRKVVFFGSIPLATKCLKEIIKRRDIDLLGVCCTEISNSWRHAEKEDTVYEFCKKNNINILNHNDIKELEPDIGISIRYNRIIEKEVIEKFKFGIVNTHGGILPAYRGTYCNIHSILNDEKEFGVTLHYIDKGIDDGDIIDILKEPISEDETGFDLYLKGEKLCYQILMKNIDNILTGTNKRIKQKQLIENGSKANVYRKKDIEGLKFIPFDKLGEDYSVKVIKAFDSPYHEPAFTIINDKKIYLRYKY